jgi:hypothetical protein
MLPLFQHVQPIKRNAWLLLLVGVLLFLVPGCRKDPPPQIIICQGDGFGGADCNYPDGHTEFWPPSKLKNSWITTQDDFARFAAWCYQADEEQVRTFMQKLKPAPALGASPGESSTR